MNVDRMTRVNELLRREIGQALFRIMNDAGFDLAAVSVTHVMTSKNLRSARVLVSIRDHEKERDKMLGLLRKHRCEMQEIIGKNVVLKYTPQLTFELDTSVEKGDKVLGILMQMEGDDDTDGAGDDGQETKETPGTPDQH